jgi:hypothetical protein
MSPMTAPTRLGFVAGLALVAAIRLPALATDGKAPIPSTGQTVSGTSGDSGERTTTLMKPLGRAGGDATRCAACHGVEGWSKVRFNHDPTGFPLRGGHSDLACGNCHPRGFDVPVADTCAGCHRDRHRGEFGANCEGCHDTQSWRPLFDADAHRRTAFPLIGQHALIPCQQCHGDMRDRTFARAPIGCVSCHRADYDRTRLTSIDHSTAGFSLDCQTCHTTWRFWPARLDVHRGCFEITSGPHHGIRCLTCHTSLPSATFTGACLTGTASCTSCHTHSCARSDSQHSKVMGYQCADMKCYECHKLTGK